MVISTSPFVRTYELSEFWELPEPRDRSKLELIKGVLYMTPPPDEVHDELVAKLIHYITATIREHGYGGTVYVPRAAIWIDEDTYLEPDLMYVSDEVKKQMEEGRRTRADLVVEVVSPSSELYDRTTKSDTYRAMGVRELWLVYSGKQKIEVRDFATGKTAVFDLGDTLESQVLPGFRFPLIRLFS